MVTAGFVKFYKFSKVRHFLFIKFAPNLTVDIYKFILIPYLKSTRKPR